MKKLIKLMACALALGTAVASADQVVLKNGDKIDGSITSMAGGKLVIHTLFAGDVTIDATQISTLSTDAPIQLKLTDGTLISRKIASDETGGVTVEGGLLGSSHVSVSDIDAINPPPVVWTGDIKFGGMLIRGYTQSDSINLDVDVAHKTDTDVLLFTGSYNYGTSHDRTTNVQTTTAERWQIEGKYERNFTKKFYGFLDGLILKDRLAFLDLRLIPSAGVGYRWFDRPDLTFATEGGVAWIYEEYNNGTPRREDVSLVLSYHLTKSFNDKVSLFHNFSYFPSLQNGKNYLINTDAGIHVVLTKQFFTELKGEVDYDSNPATGALKTDSRIVLSLGYAI